LRVLTETWLGAGGVRALAFSDEFLWNTLIAVLAAAHFIGMAHCLRNGEARGRAWAWAAGATFSLYLVHYPLMQCAAAFLPEGTPLLGALVIILAVTFGGSFLFAEAFERPLKLWRALLRGQPAGRPA
jgi:peptidoglycan/LPS O-acetylase OafA/YrhL